MPPPTGTEGELRFSKPGQNRRRRPVGQRRQHIRSTTPGPKVRFLVSWSVRQMMAVLIWRTSTQKMKVMCKNQRKKKVRLNYGSKTTPASRARQYPPGTFEVRADSMWVALFGSTCVALPCGCCAFLRFFLCAFFRFFLRLTSQFAPPPPRAIDQHRQSRAVHTRWTQQLVNRHGWG